MPAEFSRFMQVLQRSGLKTWLLLLLNSGVAQVTPLGLMFSAPTPSYTTFLSVEIPPHSPPSQHILPSLRTLLTEATPMSILSVAPAFSVKRPGNFVSASLVALFTFLPLISKAVSGQGSSLPPADIPLVSRNGDRHFASCTVPCTY